MDGNGFTSENTFEPDLAPEVPEYPKASAKYAYRVMGGSLFWLLIGSQTAALLAVFVIALFCPQALDMGWVNILLGVLPTYIVGAPLFMREMRYEAPARPERKKLPRKKLALLVFSAIGCMYVFNYLTTVLSAILEKVFGIVTPTLVFDMMTGASLPFVLGSTLVAAPLLEELFFRRFLCDRLAKYGEWQAVLFSGLAFSLFHMNFEQIFYAFVLGCLFAIVYVKTGKLRYTVLMHFCVNFVGTVPALILVKLGGLEASEQYSQLLESGAMDVAEKFYSENAAILGAVSAYSVLNLFFGIVCSVIFFRQIKRLLISADKTYMPKESRLSIMFSGKRTVAYIIICVALTVIAML